jgi:spore coat polysaccharide biosynthesis protein SpsF
MKPRTVAIIQARMGSHRLPGKTMLRLPGAGGDRTILNYLIDRISTARSLDEIVVATTTDERDDIIVRECADRGIATFRGSEHDVLGRYVGAGAASNAQIVVRVTADNPFTDPASIDRVVEVIASGTIDYAIEMDMPVGTTGEALTWNALQSIDAVAHSDRWREHVTLYAKENPDVLRCAFLTSRPERGRPDLRFTVDEMDDYVYVRNLCEHFKNRDFSLMELIAAADELDVRSRVS